MSEKIIQIQVADHPHSLYGLTNKGRIFHGSWKDGKFRWVCVISPPDRINERTGTGMLVNQTKGYLEDARFKTDYPEV